MPTNRTICPACLQNPRQMEYCGVCHGTGNVCPDCRNARFVKLRDREQQVDKQDYGPCPTCTHRIEGKLIQSRPAKDARVRQYVADREWEEDAPPEPPPVVDDEVDDDDPWKGIE